MLFSHQCKRSAGDAQEGCTPSTGAMLRSIKKMSVFFSDVQIKLPTNIERKLKMTVYHGVKTSKRNNYKANHTNSRQQGLRMEKIEMECKQQT